MSAKDTAEHRSCQGLQGEEYGYELRAHGYRSCTCMVTLPQRGPEPRRPTARRPDGAGLVTPPAVSTSSSPRVGSEPAAAAAAAPPAEAVAAAAACCCSSSPTSCLRAPATRCTSAASDTCRPGAAREGGPGTAPSCARQDPMQAGTCGNLCHIVQEMLLQHRNVRTTAAAEKYDKRKRNAYTLRMCNDAQRARSL